MSKFSVSSTEHLSLSLSLTLLRQQTSHDEQFNIINATMNSVGQGVQHSPVTCQHHHCRDVQCAAEGRAATLWTRGEGSQCQEASQSDAAYLAR